MPDICTDYHAHDGNYSPGGDSCDYIVIHNTGNTADAQAEAEYAANDQHESSYHYVLDGGGTIYQILDDTDTAWSVGAWPGCEQYIGNGESISIETCSDGDPFTDSEIDELTWLVGVLMERHGIDADHVVRHYDCHSGHKDCPAAYVDDDAWAELKSTITGGDMPTVDEIWNADLNGVKARDRLIGLDSIQVPAVKGQIDRIVEPHTANPTGDSGRLYTRDQIDRLDAKVADMAAKLDTILAALQK